MPGRPTISEHRYPIDNVKRGIDSKTADIMTVLATMIITAAEQQTMNFYMNVTNFASSEAGRRLYQEIAMVEEEHVTHYESLMDAKSSWLEKLLWHEYCECYLYWSCYQTETDPYIKNLWEENLHIEIAHLKNAEELLLKYEGKEWQEVIPCGEFPAPISLHENIDYVRKILNDTVQYTTLKEDYAKIKDLYHLADERDIVWLKFTQTGHVGVVACSNDIGFDIPQDESDYNIKVRVYNKFKKCYEDRWKYTTSGILVHSVNEQWDESFVLVIPLESENQPCRYNRHEIEIAIGNYLAKNNVPIIDYYSHNY
jgi:rubrerythrin